MQQLLLGVLLFVQMLIVVGPVDAAPLPDPVVTLASQKQRSLASYNSVPINQSVAAYFEQEFKTKLAPGSLEAVSEQVMANILPQVLVRAQHISSRKPVIEISHLQRALEELYPHTLLPNGDTVFNPESKTARVVVAEVHQDFFRDSGWHWRWVEDYYRDNQADFVTLGKSKELEVYSSERLSEFLSGYSVALLQLAAARTSANKTVSAHSIQQAAKLFRADSKVRAAYSGRYSEKTKRQTLASLPKSMFNEVTKQVGLEYLHRRSPALNAKRSNFSVPLGFEGAGVSAGDFDADGYVDIFAPGFGGGRLFKNEAGVRFRDVTNKTGILLNGESRAAYFIDFDNDGDKDLFITFAGASNRLLENQGGHFVDVTQQTGLFDETGRITHQAVWFDADNDGLLDLYLARFGSWHKGQVPTLGRDNRNGEFNLLYRHILKDGAHFFEELGESAAVADPGWTQAVGAWDFDSDRLADLFSINDFGAAHVYKNLGSWRFQEVSTEFHLDTSYNGMNFSLFDLDGKLPLELYVTEIMRYASRQRYKLPSTETALKFGDENVKNTRILVTNKLYTQASDGRFDDIHQLAIEPVDLGWSWGTNFFDYENDADLDLVVLNGTESKERPSFRGETFSQFADKKNGCFVNEQQYFYDASSRCALAFKGNSRGAAIFDFDKDGDQDVVVSNYLGPLQLFQNQTQAKNNWIEIELVGRTSNRDAIGAVVSLTHNDKAQHAVVVAGSGYLSQNPQALHFGLGPSAGLASATIRWPSGNVERISALPINSRRRIAEE